MRSIVCIALLAPALLLAVSTQPTTTLPNENVVVNGSAPLGPKAANSKSHVAFTVGTVDTIGGTTYDWGANGPALRYLVNSPGNGVHAIFMYSTSTSGTTFPDRNMRYNYYSYSSRSWSWIDPDFMASGVNTFPMRTGYGSVDNDSTGGAIISAHKAIGSTANIAPIVARDIGPGLGLWEYSYAESSGLSQMQWPWVQVTTNGVYHLAMIYALSSTQEYLRYTKTIPWPAWDSAMIVPDPQPEPGFPDQNIAVSKVAPNTDVAITWVYTGATGQEPGYIKISTDAGTTWGSSDEIPYPPAFTPMSETTPSFHLASIHPKYDRQNRLHLVAAIMPVINDTGYILPIELWHWCDANPDTWNLIYRHEPDTLAANVGYNCLTACRPSLGEDQHGNLFVAWEAFDGRNYEPGPPARLRGDIWYASSRDNGQTWENVTQLTDAGTASCRFPSILNDIDDTVMVEYLIDQKAGFFVQSEGPATNNPVVVQKWANPYSGVQEPGNQTPTHIEIAAQPNPFRGSTRIAYGLPKAGNVTLGIYDAMGRLVKNLVQGPQSAGRFTAVWDGRNAAGRQVAKGVYLYRYLVDGKRLTGKLVLNN